MGVKTAAQFFSKKIWHCTKRSYLCNPNERKAFTKRELSSAGSEHLPYKQRVDGSNPPAPTKSLAILRGFFYAHTFV